jgi:hypothetical protein
MRFPSREGIFQKHTVPGGQYAVLNHKFPSGEIVAVAAKHLGCSPLLRGVAQRAGVCLLKENFAWHLLLNWKLGTANAKIAIKRVNFYKNGLKILKL